MQSNTSKSINLIQVGDRSDDMQIKVAHWFDTGTALLWVPIFDVDDNTTATDVQAAHDEFDGGWLIHRPDDLATLPEGIKGWLLPLDDAVTDTDVVCGRWQSEVTFMRVQSTFDGEQVTFRTALAINTRLAAQFASAEASPSD